MANCIFFILAGHATTTTLLCAGLDLLVARGELVRRLLDDPTGWDPCVEELLRYVSPITRTGVRSEADVIVAGHHIAAGGQRILAYAAANRDPAVFPDPDTFDPAAPRTRTWPSPPASPSASAPRWPACTPGSPCPWSSAACPT